MPLSGRDAGLNITAQTPTSSTDQLATIAGDSLSVQIDLSTRRHWDDAGAVEIFANASTVGVGPYTVNYVQGIFNFLTTQNSSAAWTIDSEWLTASKVAGGREWTLNVDLEAFEVTEFGSSGWRQFQPNMAGANVSIGRYWNDSNFIDLIVADNPKFVVELIVSSTAGWKYEGFARIAQDSINVAVDAIVTENLNMVLDGQLYFTT